MLRLFIGSRFALLFAQTRQLTKFFRKPAFLIFLGVATGNGGWVGGHSVAYAVVFEVSPVSFQSTAWKSFKNSIFPSKSEATFSTSLDRDFTADMILLTLWKELCSFQTYPGNSISQSKVLFLPSSSACFAEERAVAAEKR